MAGKDSIDVFEDEKTLTIRFPSEIEAINQVEAKTRGFLERIGLSHEAFSICLVMREGLTNAVKHGNRGDPQKNVTYSIKLSENSLIMEIEDEGEGFDWRSIPDTEGPHIRSEHGRGIIIMKRYANEYHYNDKGNRLLIVKKFSPKKSPREDETST